MALCEVDEVKLYLGIETAHNDDLFEMLIDSASAFIENFTGRKFEVTEYTEMLNGTNKAMIPVHYAPIVEVLTIVNSYGNIKTDIKHTDNLIFLTDGSVFSSGVANWIVTYEAGFLEVPYDVRQVCIELVAYKFKQKDRIGISTKTLAGEVVSFELRDIRDDIRNTLSSYVRVV